MSGTRRARPGIYKLPCWAPTARQIQIVQLIAEGYTNKEIAAQLQISEQTAKNHAHDISIRLDAHGKANVVALCMRMGLIK